MLPAPKHWKNVHGESAGDLAHKRYIDVHKCRRPAVTCLPACLPACPPAFLVSHVSYYQLFCCLSVFCLQASVVSSCHLAIYTVYGGTACVHACLPPSQSSLDCLHSSPVRLCPSVPTSYKHCPLLFAFIHLLLAPDARRGLLKG
jgi:hypothetical protein